MTKSPFRSAIRSPRLLLIIAVAISLEFAVRLALGRGVHPFFYLLTPPIVGFVWFGLVAPTALKNDFDDREHPLKDPPTGIVRRLVLVAIVGHAFSVTLGTALFFAVDTPVQAAVYWYDSHFRSPLLMFLWPVAGVLFGTTVSWTVPALISTGILNGMTLRRSFHQVLNAVHSREFFHILTRHMFLGFVLLLVLPLVGFAGVPQTKQLAVVLRGAYTGPFLVLFLVVPITGLVLLDHQFMHCISEGEDNSFAVSSTENIDDVKQPKSDMQSGSSRNVPLLPAVVIILLILGLGTLGGAARMAELQPDPSTEDLGSTPDEMYASAVTNTLSGSYSHVTTFHGKEGGEYVRVRLSVDRSDRQIFLRGYGYFNYVSTGLQQNGPIDDEEERALHNFLSAPNIEGNPGPFSPGNYFRMIDNIQFLRDDKSDTRISGWEIVRESKEEIILSLTDVTAAASLAGADRTTENTQFDVQARIDPEDQRLQTLEVFYDTNSTSDDYDEVYEMRMTFEYDIDVERPDSLGSPSIDEYVWRALIY